ncbi:MAG: hypothetical protein HMLKMBBP_01165 [Planctomycetes bacterium]|nr:hypothetical protein [Planctomycetota bacterium]
MDSARVFASVRGAEPGPTLIVVASIHGNEPAGAVAASRVAATLREESVRGSFVAITGNVAASSRRVRCVHHDLNRAFLPDPVAAARRGEAPAGLGAEGAELRGLVRALDDARAAARGPVFLLDLHSTSGDGAPFLLLPTSGGARLASAVPLTAVSGLLGMLRGTMVEEFRGEFDGALVAECGSHGSSAAPDCAEAVIRCVLAETGIAPPDPDAPRRLESFRGALPASLAVAYRHAIAPADRFAMRPGWRHFDPVTAGTPVADDARGPVLAPVTGRMLLPLYQPVGDDGFFVAIG